MPVTTVTVLVATGLAAVRLQTGELPSLWQRHAESSPSLKPEAPTSPEPRPNGDARPAAPSRTGVLTSKYPNSEIILRYRPTVNSSPQGYGVTGDVVTILQQTIGLDDQYQWYLVRPSHQPTEAWVRGDLIREQPTRAAEDSELAQDGTAPDGLGTRASRAGASASATEPLPYSRAELDYFQEIAFGNEFGTNSEQIRKWTEDVIIQINGQPTKSDRQTLERVVKELNALIGYGSEPVQIQVLEAGDDQQANVNIYFVPHLEFPSYEPNYQPGNLGFAYVNWAQHRIYRSQILISTTGISSAERSHLIREELTQSLGLLQDSDRYEDSIFYQGWTDITNYSAIDRAVIEMLYHPKVVPGMSSHEAAIALGETSSEFSDNGRFGLRGLGLINRLVNKWQQNKRQQ